jgi:phosphopantetheinyl transferase (holo-ACP synthase)
VTISLTWAFNSCLPLVSCGIDSEHIPRFRRWARESGHFLPFLFTKNEIVHCRKLKDPAVGLCAAFCVKEALFKALKRPYQVTGCEFFFSTAAGKSRFLFSRNLAKTLAGTLPCVKIVRHFSRQITAIVYLFGTV